MPEVRLNSKKWASRASGASTDYQQGVQNPRRSQSAAAIASEPNWEAGMQAAIGRKAYSKGLQKSGDAAWQSGVQKKGVNNYRNGVVNSEDKYNAGFQPYAQVIQSTQLPPRGPKGQNYGRVQAIGDALRNAKLSR